VTEREFIEALLQHWEDGWDDLHPQDPEDPDHVPYVYENEIGSSTTSWVRLSVQHTTSEQVTMGSAPSRKFHRQGNVFVQVFCPIDQGREPLSGLLDDARTVLEGQNVGEGANLHAGQTRESATDGAWNMATLVVPFRYVEMR
jgi:hypothetical protein